MKIVDCVLEIATGSDALIEDCVELDHLSLVRVPYTHFGVSIALSRQDTSFITGLQNRRRVLLPTSFLRLRF